jgi:hypothetical protein
MSDLAAKAVVTLGEGAAIRHIPVIELTPAGMRQMLLADPWPGPDASAEDHARYRIDVTLFEECRLTDLAVFTGLPVNELEHIPPSQLRKLLDKAKDLNPDFFRALRTGGEAQSKA